MVKTYIACQKKSGLLSTPFWEFPLRAVIELVIESYADFLLPFGSFKMVYLPLPYDNHRNQYFLLPFGSFEKVAEDPRHSQKNRHTFYSLLGVSCV